MPDNKKLVITGPPGTGKSTLKQVFFEMANPILLLNNPLEPTRGAESSLFSLFQQKIGIFDLAGQENNNWLNKDKQIFNLADIIICVLDINAHIKEIMEFIGKIFEIYTEMKLNCEVIILLHKIDLVDSLYLQHKLDKIQKVIDKREKYNLKVYTTSIAKEFFISTFKIFSKIISTFLKQEKIVLKDSVIEDLKLELNIILNYETSKLIKLEKLFYDFNLNTQDSLSHLIRMQELGFVELMEDSTKFLLTEKVNILKPEVILTNESKRENQIIKILESLYIFSNLKKV